MKEKEFIRKIEDFNLDYMVRDLVTKAKAAKKNEEINTVNQMYLVNMLYSSLMETHQKQKEVLKYLSDVKIMILSATLKEKRRKLKSPKFPYTNE